MSNYISIHRYCLKTGATPQNIYRWIRENKIPKDEVRIEKVEVERIKIREDFVPPKPMEK